MQSPQPLFAQSEDDERTIGNVFRFWFRTNFPPPKDAPFHSFWFRPTQDEDAHMQETFAPLWEEACASESLRKR